MRIEDHTIVYEIGDSKAEFDFVWELRKHTCAEIIWQYPVNNYRLDFLVKGKGLSIAVEIDGRQWHDIKRDSGRDKSILRVDKSIDKIIRFEGHDAVYNASFCVKILATLYPEIFLLPVKEKGRSYTPSEILERPYELEIYTDHITKHYDNKLQFHGIYDIEFTGSKKKYEYTERGYRLEFMTPGNYIKYSYDDEVNNGADPLEYTHTKTSKVLIMERS